MGSCGSTSIKEKVIIDRGLHSFQCSGHQNSTTAASQGSSKEKFFDSRDSDGEDDDFFSVNGDFNPSTTKKKRLSELFKESIGNNALEPDKENNMTNPISGEPNKTGTMKDALQDKQRRSTHGNCFRSFKSFRLPIQRKKKKKKKKKKKSASIVMHD